MGEQVDAGSLCSINWFVRSDQRSSNSKVQLIRWSDLIKQV